MLTFEQMLSRLVIALLLGVILGFERELVKKEAGIRTEMLVSGGASLFAMIGLSLPFITAAAIGAVPDLATVNTGLGILANVVVGIGFLGAGLIIKTNTHPTGVTTAAEVWATAAIGILVGIGLMKFAAAATLLVVFLLYVLRKMKVSDRLEKEASSKKR